MKEWNGGRPGGEPVDYAGKLPPRLPLGVPQKIVCDDVNADRRIVACVVGRRSPIAIADRVVLELDDVDPQSMTSWASMVRQRLNRRIDDD